MLIERRRVWIVIGLIASWIAASAGPAQADCNSCNESGCNCVWEFWPLDHWGPGSAAGPNIDEDPGSSIGIALARTHENDVTVPADVLAGSPVIGPSALVWGNDVDVVNDHAATFDDAIVGTDFGPIAVQLQTVVPGAQVPLGQGVPQTGTATGTGSSGNGALADPVDPITGEFIIRHTDLEFPGFGVALRMTRTYRSRVDYDGPLGPGWDHSYNQRLFSLPDVPIDGPPEPGTAYPRLASAAVRVPLLTDNDAGATCGPTLLLSTGESTTVRFREIGRSGSTISYWSSAAHLTLTGTDAPAGPTWTLRSPSGDVRHFNADGNLVQWVDSNGIGLALGWTGTGDDARVEAITDSVGRIIELEYDASRRLLRAVEPASGLEATYSYDSNGGLEIARSSDGRQERYEYDVDPGRERGDWIPEEQLRPACAAACARSDSTCDTGGACDEPVAEAMTTCEQWIAECPAQCNNVCNGACQEACLEDQCNARCEVEHLDDLKETCRDTYDQEAETICNSCDEQCEFDAASVCADAYAVGDILDTQIAECADRFASCCSAGVNCGPDSCNAANPLMGSEPCSEKCEQGFLGFEPVATQCEQPASSVPYGCLAIAIDRCKVGGFADGILVDGCADLCANPVCVPACQTECQPNCNPSICAALPGQCEDSCTASCIIEGELRGGDLLVRLYGHDADLNFNLVRGYDGANRLYLENVYGTDPRHPDFDTVVSQTFGEYNPLLARWDLVAESAGVDRTGLAAWAAPLIDVAEAFEPVDICPFTCKDTPVGLGEIVVPITADGLLLVFSPAAVTSPVGGFPVNKTLTQVVSPTLVTFSRNQAGTVVGKISRRTSTTNYLATTATSLPITLDNGATATLTTSTTGAVTVTGTAAGKDQLFQMKSLTLFTDAAKRVQAYPGAPSEVLKISSGSCTAPFTFQRVSDSEILMSPAAACLGDLWLTPMAGQYPDQTQADRFARDGLAALSTSAFHPSSLSPTRGGFIWRQGIDGRRVREAPPTATGQTDAGKAAVAQYAKAPMFSAPTQTSGIGEPLFVFHHVAANYAVTSPPPIPSDVPWTSSDPIPTFPITCDPTVPAPAIRGNGARPTQATAVTDFHGARWTLYADEDNNVLRSVNHETTAVWSFNYDPVGQLIGVEHPDRARTCMIYDAGGNVKRWVRMPATVQGLPTPDPIEEDYQFHAVNGAVTWIGDPRSPGTMFRRIDRDAAGNPTAVVEADLVTSTSMSLVGGTGPERAQIGSIVEPGPTTTLIGYDYAAGTMSSLTVDAFGPLSMRDEMTPDEAGRVVSHVSPLGLEQTRSYEGPFLQFSDWSGDGHAGRQTLEYDADGQVSAVLVGSLGSARVRTELTYEPTGALTTVKRSALDGTAATSFECQDMAPGRRLRETVSGEGIRTRYTRDGEGRVLSVQRGDLGPSSRAWDDSCLAHPTGGTQAFTLATFTYDTSGRMISSTDERGRLTTITNDGFGRPIMENRPDGTQARRGYDAMGNVIWEALYSTGSAPPYRPPSWGDSALQAATEYVFDNRARISEVRRWHFEGLQVAVGDGYSTSRFTYADAQHKVTLTDDAGNQWIRVSDGAGRPVEEQAPDGTKRSFAYPDRRTVQISEPGPAGTITREIALTAWSDVASEAARVGSTSYSLTSSQFDELLRPISTTSLTGEISAVSYDAFGRTKTQQQSVPGGAGETLTLGYNRDDQPVSRASAAPSTISGTWTWSYDALGREIRAVDPGNGQLTTTYVLGSQLPSVVTDQRGVQFQHTWATGANQLTLNAVDPAGLDVASSYVWNGRGNLVSAIRTDETQPSVVNAFTYDSLGNKVKETDNQLPVAWSRTAQFDGRGLLAKTTVNTTSWARSYDSLGRLGSIKVGTESTPLATYTYSGFDFRLTRGLGNGLETRYQYDTLGRQIGQTDIKPSTGAASATWAWQVPLDGVPRRADFRRTNGGADNAVFTVDAALRLLKEDGAAPGTFGLTATTSFATANTTAATALGAQTWHYGLDGHSAWIQRIRGTTGTTTYTRDSRDALTKVNTTNVALDARGAITNDGSIQVIYDAVGMPSRVTSGTKIRSYRRDALGRIVSETDQANLVTKFAYDGPTRVVRQRSNGTTFDINIDGADLDEHVATITGATRKFLHQDRLGSVYLVTEGSGSNAGASLEWTSYSAYGEATLRNPAGTPITTSTVAAQFGFNGLPHDFLVGVVDMRARTYRPVLGRFLSPDPLGLIDGTNRFGFVGGSPLSFRDPFGLDKEQKSQTLEDLGRDFGQMNWEIATHQYYQYQADANREIANARREDIRAFVEYMARASRVAEFLVKLQATGASFATAPAATTLSYLVAGSSSDGDFRGMGAVAGVGGGIAAGFRSSAYTAEATALDLATESNSVPAASGSVAASRANVYSVAYEMHLNPADYGKARSVHFSRARAELDADIKADQAFANSMEEIIPGVARDVSPVGGSVTPRGWVWHHDVGPGVMQLVQISQHTPGSTWWRIFHPGPGARGGYSIWGIPNGAPPN